MAYETIAVTAGTGTNIAFDLVGSQNIQVVKLDLGGDGVSVPVATQLPVEVTKVAGTTTPTGSSGLMPSVISTPNMMALTTGAAFATVFPGGFLRVSTEPSQVFYDPFDAALDTVNTWKASSATGGAVAPSVASGNLTLGTGTTANGYTSLESNPSFRLMVPGWLGVSFAIKLENPITANTYRFWGTGTSPGTPTAALPLTDAVGFEIATDGKMYCVVYASGTRTAVQDLSAATGNSKQPTDANSHRYICYVRTDKVYWAIDSLDNIVGQSAFQSPNIQTLPLKFAAIAGTTPLSSGTLTCSGVAVWDTTHGNITISDPTYGWRKPSVNNGALQVGGTVSTSNPSVANGTIQPLSLTTAGSLRVEISDVLTSGTVTATGLVASIPCQGDGSVNIQVSATAIVATLQFEATVDGTNWFPIPMFAMVGTSGTSSAASTVVGSYGGPVYTTTVAGIYACNAAGFSSVRVWCTAFTSATAASVSMRTCTGTFTPRDPAMQAPSLTSTTTAAADVLAIAATAGLSIYITNLVISNAGAQLTVVTVKDGNAGTSRYQVAIAPGGGTFNLALSKPWKLTAGAGLYINQSVAIQIYCTANYYLAP